MKYKLTKEVSREELKIPKGYRLIEDWELCKLYRTDKKIEEKLREGWLWCNTKFDMRVAGLSFNGGYFSISGNDYISGQGRSRGVLVKLEEE